MRTTITTSLSGTPYRRGEPTEGQIRRAIEASQRHFDRRADLLLARLRPLIAEARRTGSIPARRDEVTRSRHEWIATQLVTRDLDKDISDVAADLEAELEVDAAMEADRERRAELTAEIEDLRLILRKGTLLSALRRQREMERKRIEYSRRPM